MKTCAEYLLHRQNYETGRYIASLGYIIPLDSIFVPQTRPGWFIFVGGYRGPIAGFNILYSDVGAMVLAFRFFIVAHTRFVSCSGGWIANDEIVPVNPENLSSRSITVFAIIAFILYRFANLIWLVCCLARAH